MPRPETPEIVLAWRDRQPVPKCCHTCDFYNEDGICIEFDAEPPELFAKQPGSCPAWVQEIPF